MLFVDQGDEQALRVALAEKPKLVLVESPSNPLLRVVDIAKICHLAREVGAVSVVDNTFLSPALQNPLALGADLVLHSCTKYLNGHSDVVAGVVIAKDPDVVTELAWWANNIGVTGGAFDSSHAATMTHAGMAPEARAAAGISETLLRISTGIEDGEDLIADLENGFRAANKG